MGNLFICRAAVQECPSSGTEIDDRLMTERKQRNLATNQKNIRELIGEYDVWMSI